MTDRRLREVPEEMKIRVSSLVEKFGAAEAATLLGVSRGTILAICAGCEVMPGTLALVEKGLHDIGSNGGEAA